MPSKAVAIKSACLIRRASVKERRRRRSASRSRPMSNSVSPPAKPPSPPREERDTPPMSMRAGWPSVRLRRADSAPEGPAKAGFCEPRNGDLAENGPPKSKSVDQGAESQDDIGGHDKPK